MYCARMIVRWRGWRSGWQRSVRDLNTSKGEARLLLYWVIRNEAQFSGLYVALNCRYKFYTMTSFFFILPHPRPSYPPFSSSSFSRWQLFFYHRSLFLFLSSSFDFFLRLSSILFVICSNAYLYFTINYVLYLVVSRVLRHSPSLNPLQNSNFSPFI